MGEYDVELCFIRPRNWGEASLLEEVRELVCHLFAGARTDVEHGEEDGLDVAVAKVNGLAVWDNEEDLLDWLDDALPESWWDWLAGYKVNVMKKEDAGPCLIKRRGSWNGC
ncbi:hypothetical protein [Paenibacillus sp. MMS18-CY102]|uniref:hypothetical protein n=1 Tax=Paenibacillus sp. MMS18-CY102 TaxID=2682849 RepID=UPI001365B908|nr:hypothetical protein [Paenibacillus sp. MMS18-CY102]MWC29894.1 hypothetical protein [Paenibacillus sp. MMS18-CY102]